MRGWNHQQWASKHPTSHHHHHHHQWWDNRCCGAIIIQYTHREKSDGLISIIALLLQLRAYFREKSFSDGEKQKYQRGRNRRRRRREKVIRQWCDANGWPVSTQQSVWPTNSLPCGLWPNTAQPRKFFRASKMRFCFWFFAVSDPLSINWFDCEELKGKQTSGK